ncbi:hypothetical protein [Natrinema soli]|uniref:Uncharacterized protein n=1 Tax=Natrinema soli TaxID=1930624 RepID=A0ABD5SLN7_9EURY|nr:hypothetical protein [Natrinema soli]
MVDLNDFGAGVDHDPGPEDGLRLELSNWIRSDDIDVYWDRDHDFGWGTFDINQRHRPDMVVDGPARTYAIEVKIGEDSAKVHDGMMQLVKYWRSYVDGDDVYRADGKRLNIDAFLIASKHSPYGRLYSKRGGGESMGDGTGSRQNAVEIGEIPKKEFIATERAIRVMWRLTKEQRPDATCGIGALLSSKLDGDAGGVEHTTPGAQYKSHGGQQPDGWSNPRYQWWEYIPFYERGEA